MRTLIIATATLMFASASASAATATNTSAQPGPGVTVVHLTQRAERLMPRDRLHAVLSVEVTAATPQQVQAEVNKRMEAALQKAHQVSAVKPETGGYLVYQQREPNKPVSWRGQQTLNLSSQATAELLQLVGDLQQQGLATTELAYELSPDVLRKAEDDLTAEALAAMGKRADAIAAGLKLVVQQLRDVVVGNAQTDQPPMRMRTAVLNYVPAPAAPPVAEPGDAVVSVSVQAEVWLAPKGQ
jgi:uncharacterized protein